MTQTGGVHGVVLAAGRGTRFGGQKLMAELRGRPLLEHVLGVAADARRRGELAALVVVLPPDDPALQALAAGAGAAIILQPHPEKGLAASLRLGLDAAEGAAAAMIFLGDQPLVHPMAVTALLAAHEAQPDAILRPAAPAAGGEPGHPVVVPNRWWPSVRGTEGDVGIGRLLAGVAPVVALDLPWENPDVDTPADLDHLARRQPGDH